MVLNLRMSLVSLVDVFGVATVRGGFKILSGRGDCAWRLYNYLGAATVRGARAKKVLNVEKQSLWALSLGRRAVGPLINKFHSTKKNLKFW